MKKIGLAICSFLSKSQECVSEKSVAFLCIAGLNKGNGTRVDVANWFGIVAGMFLACVVISTLLISLVWLIFGTWWSPLLYILTPFLAGGIMYLWLCLADLAPENQPSNDSVR